MTKSMGRLTYELLDAAVAEAISDATGGATEVGIVEGVTVGFRDAQTPMAIERIISPPGLRAVVMFASAEGRLVQAFRAEPVGSDHVYVESAMIPVRGGSFVGEAAVDQLALTYDPSMEPVGNSAPVLDELHRKVEAFAPYE